MMDKYYPALFCFTVVAVAVIISIYHNWQKQRQYQSKQAILIKANGGVR